MNDSPVDCQNAKLPQATFVTRAAARPAKTLPVKRVDYGLRSNVFNKPFQTANFDATDKGIVVANGF